MGWKKTIENVRYPHTCTITRKEEADPFAATEDDGTVIYEGPCRVYKNTSIRTFDKSGEAGYVSTDDMQASIPVKTGDGIQIRESDLITFTDANETYTEVMIKSAYTNAFGTLVSFTKTKN